MLSSFSLGLLCSLDVARLSSLNRLVLNHRNRPAVETNLSGLYLHSRSLLREKRVTVIFLFFSPLRFILFNALEMIAIVTRICEYIYIRTRTRETTGSLRIISRMTSHGKTRLLANNVFVSGSHSLVTFQRNN